MGTKRTVDSGRRDALGRRIKIAEQTDSRLGLFNFLKKDHHKMNEEYNDASQQAAEALSRGDVDSYFKQLEYAAHLNNRMENCSLFLAQLPDYEGKDQLLGWAESYRQFSQSAPKNLPDGAGENISQKYSEAINRKDLEHSVNDVKARFSEMYSSKEEAKKAYEDALKNVDSTPEKVMPETVKAHKADQQIFFPQEITDEKARDNYIKTVGVWREKLKDIPFHTQEINGNKVRIYQMSDGSIVSPEVEALEDYRVEHNNGIFKNYDRKNTKQSLDEEYRKASKREQKEITHEAIKDRDRTKEVEKKLKKYESHLEKREKEDAIRAKQDKEHVEEMRRREVYDRIHGDNIDKQEKKRRKKYDNHREAYLAEREVQDRLRAEWDRNAERNGVTEFLKKRKERQPGETEYQFKKRQMGIIGDGKGRYIPKGGDLYSAVSEMVTKAEEKAGVRDKGSIRITNRIHKGPFVMNLGRGGLSSISLNLGPFQFPFWDRNNGISGLSGFLRFPRSVDLPGPFSFRSNRW